MTKLQLKDKALYFICDMKYLFIHALNALSKDGNLKPKHSAWFSALTMLSGSTICWIGIVVILIYHYILNEPIVIPNTMGLALLTISFGILYYYLVKDKKHELIIEEYKDETAEKNRIGKILTALYIFSPWILLMLVALIVKHRI